MRLRVLLVGDDVLARAGLLALLAGRGDLEAVGQASSDDIGRLADDADVVLWDPGAGSRLDADWLEDTPECPNIGRESLENCPDYDNLMFPIASFRDTVLLSEDQVLILRANPLVAPNGGDGSEN